MNLIKKILLGLGALILGLFTFIQIAGNKKFDAPYPDITASKDSAIISRGEYLAYGPAHCAHCHIPMDKMKEVDGGMKMPLVGGLHYEFPPVVTINAPNLTPDEETGIGKLTDQEIARSLRYGINHEGRYMLPFMPYDQMNDEDITAIISFLRSQPEIKNELPPTKFKFIGKALIAFGIFKPKPVSEIPQVVKKEVSVAYGSYLAVGLCDCMSCHTDYDIMTAKFTSEPYSGGAVFEPDALSLYYGFISPNLTPDKETGWITNWSEETFINRFKGGRVYDGSPMPWGAFSKMDSTDIKAIYLFLNSLEPVHHKIERIVYPPEDAALFKEMMDKRK